MSSRHLRVVDDNRAELETSLKDAMDADSSAIRSLCMLHLDRHLNHCRSFPASVGPLVGSNDAVGEGPKGQDGNNATRSDICEIGGTPTWFISSLTRRSIWKRILGVSNQVEQAEKVATWDGRVSRTGACVDNRECDAWRVTLQQDCARCRPDDPVLNCREVAVVGDARSREQIGCTKQVGSMEAGAGEESCRGRVCLDDIMTAIESERKRSSSCSRSRSSSGGGEGSASGGGDQDDFNSVGMRRVLEGILVCYCEHRQLVYKQVRSALGLG